MATRTMASSVSGMNGRRRSAVRTSPPGKYTCEFEGWGFEGWELPSRKGIHGGHVRFDPE